LEKLSDLAVQILDVLEQRDGWTSGRNIAASLRLETVGRAYKTGTWNDAINGLLAQRLIESGEKGYRVVPRATGSDPLRTPNGPTG
jgi:hypothetical protein